MFRLTFYLNLILILMIAVTVFFIVKTKSQIAYDRQEVAQLNRTRDDEAARHRALTAEWARVQQRQHILNLARARFGDEIAEIAQEARLEDLPDRSAQGGGDWATAQDLFERAVAEITLQELSLLASGAEPSLRLPPPNPTDADPVTRLILENHGGL